MMDYNIYIHSIQDGGSPSPTTPWEPKGEGEGTIPWKKAEQAVQHPMSLASGAASFAKKAIPGIAAAFVAVKIAEKAYSMGTEIASIETGDYRRQTDLNNLRNAFSWITSPVGQALSWLKAEQRYRIEDARRAQNRQLYGDSVLNQYAGRGV